jgi:hypothetical protein
MEQGFSPSILADLWQFWLFWQFLGARFGFVFPITAIPRDDGDSGDLLLLLIRVFP